MIWNSARGLFIIAEAWAATVFVICSAFVINSITKGSTPCQVVKVKPLTRGLSLVLLQLREKPETSQNSSHLHIVFGAGMLQLTGGSICFSSTRLGCRRWAFFPHHFAPVGKWEFGGSSPPSILYLTLLYKENSCINLFEKRILVRRKRKRWER